MQKADEKSSGDVPAGALPKPKADIGKLSGLKADALDGSKKIIAEKNKQRATVIKELRLLGRYVEVSRKNDIFKSSGFEPGF